MSHKVSEKWVYHQQTGIHYAAIHTSTGIFFGSRKSNQISTPAFSSVSIQSVLVICMAWKPAPASNASPEHILLQFQLITTCFIHDGCGNLTKLSLQIPFKKSFLQTKTSVFPDWKATLASGFFFLGKSHRPPCIPALSGSRKRTYYHILGSNIAMLLKKPIPTNNPPSPVKFYWQRSSFRVQSTNNEKTDVTHLPSVTACRQWQDIWAASQLYLQVTF